MSEKSPSANIIGYKYEGKQIVKTSKVGRPRVFRNPNYYSLEQKTEAATLYCVWGDVKEVSKLTKIPETVIRGWKEEPWWVEIQKQVFVEQNDKLSSKISFVLEKAITEISDRLENGDQTYNPKTGEITRKPIEARVLTSLFESLSHQRRITRGEPTAISARVGVDDRLDKLQQAFIKFANAQTIEGEVINDAKEDNKDEENERPTS